MRDLFTKKQSLSEKGLTICNLLIVVCLFSLLSRFAYLSLAEILVQKRLQRVTREVELLVLHQSILAVKEGINRSIVFNRNSIEVAQVRNGVSITIPKIQINNLLISEAAFARDKENKNKLLLRSSGRASPGRIVMVSPDGSHCRIYFSLYAATRKECWRVEK